MEDVFLTMEHTMVAKGQLEIVQQARRTFQAQCVMSSSAPWKVGLRVENYEGVTFTAPDRILEIFYLEPVKLDGSEPPVLYETDAVNGE